MAFVFVHRLNRASVERRRDDASCPFSSLAHLYLVCIDRWARCSVCEVGLIDRNCRWSHVLNYMCGSICLPMHVVQRSLSSIIAYLFSLLLSISEVSVNYALLL
jgi:hypothetical protein